MTALITTVLPYYLIYSDTNNHISNSVDQKRNDILREYYAYANVI